METITKEDGVLAVMLLQFERRWLPDTLQIKEKVDRGEVLSDWAAAYLDDAIREISQAKAIADRHPELQSLYARTAGLYMEITTKALDNEANPQARSLQ